MTSASSPCWKWNYNLRMFSILDLSTRVATQEEGVHGSARETRREVGVGEQQLPAESEDAERRKQQFAKRIAAALVHQLPEKPVARHQQECEAFTAR